MYHANNICNKTTVQYFSLHHDEKESSSNHLSNGCLIVHWSWILSKQWQIPWEVLATARLPRLLVVAMCDKGMIWQYSKSNAMIQDRTRDYGRRVFFLGRRRCLVVKTLRDASSINSRPTLEERELWDQQWPRRALRSAGRQWECHSVNMWWSHHHSFGRTEVHGGANMYQIAVLNSLVIEDSTIRNGTGLVADNMADRSSIGSRWWMVG